MSPVDRAGPLTGTSFALGSYEKIQPGFRDEKRPKILGTSFGAKLEKQNKDGETQPSYYFCAYRCLGNPVSCITAAKRVANDVENSSGKENDAIRIALVRKRNYSLCDEKERDYRFFSFFFLIQIRLLLVTWRGEKRTLSCCVSETIFKKRYDTFYRIFNC